MALTEDQREELEDLVHDVASQIASDVINEGKEWDFLLTNGWSDTNIRSRVGLDVPTRPEYRVQVGRLSPVTLRVPEGDDNTFITVQILRSHGDDTPDWLEDVLGVEFSDLEGCEGVVTVGHWPDGEEWVPVLTLRP